MRNAHQSRLWTSVRLEAILASSQTCWLFLRVAHPFGYMYLLYGVNQYWHLPGGRPRSTILSAAVSGRLRLPLELAGSQNTQTILRQMPNSQQRPGKRHLLVTQPCRRIALTTQTHTLPLLHFPLHRLILPACWTGRDDVPQISARVRLDLQEMSPSAPQ